MAKESETLDRLYLEWSQFTGARTEREIRLRHLLSEAVAALRGCGYVELQAKIDKALKELQ